MGTPGEVYQKKCAKEFDQEFDNDAWDDWFDKEIERLEDEADRGGGGGNASSASLWNKPSAASKKDLADLSKYLGDLLAKAGPDDDTPGEVYQKKCSKEFDQKFDNDAWDDWFDKEIERWRTKPIEEAVEVTPAVPHFGTSHRMRQSETLTIC